MGTEYAFGEGWSFLLLLAQSDREAAARRADEFCPVNLPHDWLIGHTDWFSAKLAQYGWYRKTFCYDKDSTKEKVLLCFDGVYMNSTVYLNQEVVCNWRNGYTRFYADLTPFLKSGENEIFVCVRYETPNSRWYSGAGIYRNVTMIKLPLLHLVPEGIYISCRKRDEDFNVNVSTELSSAVSEWKSGGTPLLLCHTLRDPASGSCIYKTEQDITQDALRAKEVQCSFLVKKPELWELSSPKLYELVTELVKEGEVIDRQTNRFGFRTILFDPDRGFFLNGVHVLLQGVCEHHDLGCLGAAFYKSAMKRKLITLKKMGANAVRISHNMPAREVVELADEMGMLLISELYDMWERPKNKFDFARFFQESYKADTASFVRRDRNSPSIILWSIGNEIYDTHMDERGQEITALLRDEVRKHDPAQNAYVTIASNYMPWEKAQKCADLVKIAGYNYAEKYYEEHHRLHPDWVIYGSETASVVQSRGIYHFPADRQILADDDLQCSSLGNSITSWGAKSLEAGIVAERDCPFSLGQFIWTGFDYIGEPTPYHTKNSYFGQIDTAGFEKDSYYLYQSAWTDYLTNPMVHLFPYWDFNEGQMIDVGIRTNAPLAELFVNGISQGRKKIDHEKGEVLTAFWKVPYQKGYIEAKAYDFAGQEIASQKKCSFSDAFSLVLEPEEVDGLKENDMYFVKISAIDQQGHPVENANNRVKIIVRKGKLIGLDNGDSTDYESYQSDTKRMFSGKLLAVIVPDKDTDLIRVEAISEGMIGAGLVLGKNAVLDQYENYNDYGIPETTEIPIRKIEICCPDGNQMNAEKKIIEVNAVLHPPNCRCDGMELEWSVTDEAGISSHIAELTKDGTKVLLKAKGDGICLVRCMAQNGKHHISLISQIEVTISGLGNLAFDPYSFLSAGLYSYCKGTPGNGNERGVATARDGETQIGFENLDFGSYGSDEITIPIFALTDEEYPIQIWEGFPGETKSELLANVVYQKKSIWNVYQEETYRLKRRVKNLSKICFVTRQKIHIKGFSFTKQNRGTAKLFASEADRIYGDSYDMGKEAVREIGNNVSFVFEKLDFMTEGITKIVLCGHSPIAQNSIHLCFLSEAGEDRQLIEFAQTESMEEKVFELNCVKGVVNVTFLFLPGSRFDFGWFYFE